MKTNYEYDVIRLILAKIVKKSLIYITGEFSKRLNLTLELNLKPGKYLILIDRNKKNEIFHNVNASNVKNI